MTQKNHQTTAPKGLKEQRERRQRINRIKTGIIVFIAGWMAVCMILNLVLLARVSSLQSQIDILAEKMLERTVQAPNADVQVQSGELSEDTEDETDDSGSGDTATDSDKNTDSNTDTNAMHEQVRQCLDRADNLRSEDEPMTVYLTFDDGPSENTPEILDILAEHQVKATFFVTGKEGDDAKEWYQQIAEQGHTLGMHSYSHRYSTIYESVDAFAEDYTKLSDYLEEITGVKSRFYRFPGGSSNQVSNTDMNEFVDYLGEQNVTYYDWNVVSGDATSQIYTADELVENVMADIGNYRYSVVLMHDAAEKDSTVEALEQILQRLEELDAEILPITDDSPVIHHTLTAYGS